MELTLCFEAALLLNGQQGATMVAKRLDCIEAMGENSPRLSSCVTSINTFLMTQSFVSGYTE